VDVPNIHQEEAAMIAQQHKAAVLLNGGSEMLKVTADVSSAVHDVTIFMRPG
jgi:hypothetical protein